MHELTVASGSMGVKYECYFQTGTGQAAHQVVYDCPPTKEAIMANEVVQDTIDFVLAAEDTVVNDTVKLVVNISCTRDSKMPHQTLMIDIRQMMENFIKGAKWDFSGLIRSEDTSGMEKVDLQASARVSESENFGLDKRSREVGREGMQITLPISADTTPPMSMIEECESALRAKLLGKARKELEVINTAMSDTYRISSISFQTTNNPFTLSNRSPKTAMATSYGSSFTSGGGSDDDVGLGNAVKIGMRAVVTYRKIINTSYLNYPSS
jgi:hypothetical protein